MKTASFPAVQVEIELRQAAEDSLKDGETIAAFVEQSIRDSVERRQRHRRFVEEGAASRDEAAMSGQYRSADEVFAGLEKVRSKAKEQAEK